MCDLFFPVISVIASVIATSGYKSKLRRLMSCCIYFVQAACCLLKKKCTIFFRLCFHNYVSCVHNWNDDSDLSLQYTYNYHHKWSLVKKQMMQQQVCSWLVNVNAAGGMCSFLSRFSDKNLKIGKSSKQSLAQYILWFFSYDKLLHQLFQVKIQNFALYR